LTDEVTDSCECVKFAISIAYKNGGILKDIVENDQNGVFVDKGICFVKYVDRQDTFSSGGDFQVVNRNCLQIGTANLLSVVYNYTDTAANILSEYPSIDTSRYSKTIGQACNASAGILAPRETNSSAPLPSKTNPVSALSVPAPATGISASPKLSPEEANSSAPAPNSEKPTLSPANISDSTAASPKPSASVVASPTPAPSNSALNARPVLAWIIAFVMVVFLFIGSSYGEIVVVNPVDVCPGTSSDGQDQLATATQQADDGTARNALQNEILGSDGALVADPNPIEGI
jgi:hypothetical protein